jgi:hypothetical protein
MELPEDAMSEHQDAHDMLDRAERAAMAGDLASADELLRSAARIQEEELGPLHPDLANTLNNLAVVAEKTGHPSEAETFYRRAVAIASASLPSEHPMVVASRQNLEDFCHARSISIEAPAVIPPTRDTVGPDVSAVEQPPVASRTPQPVPRPPAPPTSRPLPLAPTSGRGSHRVAWVATGVVILLAAVLLVLRPWSPRDVPVEAEPPARAAPPAAPTTIEPAGPPKAVSSRDDRNVATNKSPAPTPTPTPGAVTLATAELCQHFSTSGRNWRCDQVGNSVAPGPIVLYTRVRSPHDVAVVHRWYREGTLRQSVRLAIRASSTEGYRTYSRQTVNPGDWRVEVRSAEGNLLHEQRFAVR